MASISVGNQLYLYRLFSREVGVGRQVMLSRMEEVLDADDIWPSDLGCATTRELLEQLSSFVRLTVFKKGRVYATVIAVPDWNAILERAEKEQAAPATATAATSKGGPRSWKRKKAKRDPKPARPRPKGRPKPQDESVETTESGATKPEKEPAAEPAPQPTTAEPTAAEPTPQPTTAEPAPQPTTAESETRPKAEEASIKESVTEPVQDVVEEQESSYEPVASNNPLPADSQQPSDSFTAQPSIKFTIISKPEATEPEAVPSKMEQPGMDFSSDIAPVNTFDPAPEQGPEPQPVHVVNPTPSPTTQAKLPQDFCTQVLLRNDELNALYQMLPLDQDPIAVLDEDWRVARSTHDYVQKNGVVTFPLRYLATPNGEPVRVSMKRAGASVSGKRWVVTAVSHVNDAGFEGLAQTNNEVMRELAQFGVLGPWDDVVQRLADALAGAKNPFTKEELRDYLCITFHRLQCENKVATYAQNTRAIFDTGLLDAQARSVFMDFHASEDDIPWEFDRFATANELATDEALPQPASYIANLHDIMIASEKDVCVSKALLHAHGQDIAEAIDATLRRIRRDYRLATPAYDPLTNEVRLLAPIEWPANATQALVLRPSSEGFVASALLSLARAAACARIVSFELPSWLC